MLAFQGFYNKLDFSQNFAGAGIPKFKVREWSQTDIRIIKNLT